MLKENIETIIDILILKDKSSVDVIIEEAGLESSLVTHAINILKALDLVKKDKDKLYLNKDINSFQLAKTAQLGIDLISFNYFYIDEEKKKLALELATNIEKIKQLEVNKRKPLIQKRLYFKTNDEIADNLIMLLETSSLTLYEYLENLAKKDDYLKILLEMHEQSENSLSNYLEYTK